MYTIYAGDHLIYSPSLFRSDCIVFEPQLNMELNKAATLTFKIPQANERREFLELLKTEIFVFDGDRQSGRRLFRGRVISRVKDFQQTMEVTCEGELAYLRDVVMRPYDWTASVDDPGDYFSAMLDAYNADTSIESYKKFAFGVCDVDGEVGEYKNDQYPDILSEMTEKLLNVNGGYFVPRIGEDEHGNEINYLDYLTDPGGTETGGRQGAQKIKYAKNLLDITDEYNAAPVFTVVIPLGAQVETGETDPETDQAIKRRLTIESAAESGGLDYIADIDIYNGEERIYEGAVTKYGWIENVVTHDEIDNANDLYAAGKEDLENAIQPQRTLEISAIDLSLINPTDEPLTLGKQYQILFEAGGYTHTSDRVRLNRIEMSLFNPSESRYYFGELFYGITHEAVTTKRTMNQVTKVALEAAEQSAEVVAEVATLKTTVTGLQTTVSALQTAVGNLPSVKAYSVTVNNITWNAKLATVTLTNANFTTTARYSVNIVTAGTTVAVGGIKKSTAGELQVTLISAGTNDPTSLDFDVQMIG